MLALSLVAALSLQSAPQAATDDPLPAVALCVAALEYPGAHPATEAARAAWRLALDATPGSDPASREAAVAEQRQMLDDTGARAGSDGIEVARAVGILAPNCLSAEAGSRVAARFANPETGA
ncbi:hypothetical protein GVN24_29710 [Rhizobium sp. CRIBSB]|nr:hypothetical protein [Rhizobium sp. CRIBSB]